MVAGEKMLWKIWTKIVEASTKTELVHFISIVIFGLCGSNYIQKKALNVLFNMSITKTLQSD